MKLNQWTIVLAAVGIIGRTFVVQAEDTANTVLTALPATTLSGYVDTSAQWNPGSARSTSAYTFGGKGAKDDGFNLNVIDLKLEKLPDDSEWAAGYKTELWMGPNASSLGTTAAGTVNTTSEFAIKQAYVELRAPVGNGIDFKVGVWDTPIGYESLNAGDDPNFTRSWGCTIEPTEHTGLLANYRFNDSISATAGIANTTDAIVNGRESGEAMKTYMATVALTAPESFGFLKGATLYTGTVHGRASTSTAAVAPDHTWIYVGATVPTPLKDLTAGLAWDHVTIPDTTGLSAKDTDAVTGYLIYKVTERLTLNGRLDYIRMGGDGFAGDGALIAGAGIAPGNQFLTTTLTADFALWKNVMSRLEYRWDHDLKTGQHFGQGTRNNDQLLALNLIYKF